uniref:Photosystem II 10 kDa polypeptide n=1 Tax=Rhizophora mucronata TaxID=61149 RepID=A0A2P2K0M7_RHIMU
MRISLEYKCYSFFFFSKKLKKKKSYIMIQNKTTIICFSIGSGTICLNFSTYMRNINRLIHLLCCNCCGRMCTEGC